MSTVRDRFRRELVELFKNLDERNILHEDGEIQSHWARYLCVLVSGYLEVSIREIVKDYVRRAARAPVANHVIDRIDRFQNADIDKIVGLLATFDSQWSADFSEIVEGDMKIAITSIVGSRHQIAHGERATVSYPEVKRHFGLIVEALDLLEEHYSTEGTALATRIREAKAAKSATAKLSSKPARK